MALGVDAPIYPPIYPPTSGLLRPCENQPILSAARAGMRAPAALALGYLLRLVSQTVKSRPTVTPPYIHINSLM